jgi:hypothetical protein
MPDNDCLWLGSVLVECILIVDETVVGKVKMSLSSLTISKQPSHYQVEAVEPAMASESCHPSADLHCRWISGSTIQRVNVTISTEYS